MENRETFLQIHRLPLQLLILKNWIHGGKSLRSRFISTAEKSERPEQNQDLRCQSGPSAKDSVIFSGGDSSKNYGADQQRLQISDPHFDEFPTTATFACWKTRFKTEVCTCSQFPTEAMHWIKEVELVDSMDDINSSCSVKGFQRPNFEVLDAKIRVIHNTQFKRKVSLEEHKGPEAGPFPSWKIDRLPDLRVLPGSLEPTILSRTMPTYSLSFYEMTIFRNSIRKWDGLLLSMTKIPSDDILEGLYKLRIRVSEKLKTVLELYNMEIHQKKIGPDYHRLKDNGEKKYQARFTN